MEIDDKQDAEDAIKDINGKNFNGGQIRVRVDFFPQLFGRKYLLLSIKKK